ncbi:hypothetical protein [Rhodoligotrophos ferricapiens]|uniref:hypothetical protein n=1 Tax=Rhodoligotrophos ferricapiens TaxID=3069264 RepID=UPI00315CAFAD
MAAAVSTLGPATAKPSLNAELADRCIRYKALADLGIDQIASETVFDLAEAGPEILREFAEARSKGIRLRPTVQSPVSSAEPARRRVADLAGVISRAASNLKALAAAGADWVQINEPCLAMALDRETAEAISTSYGLFAQAAPQLKLLLVPGRGALSCNHGLILSLPVTGIHLDCYAEPDQLADLVVDAAPESYLSLGISCTFPPVPEDLLGIFEQLELVALQRGLVETARACANPWPVDLGGRIDFERLAVERGADRLILATSHPDQDAMTPEALQQLGVVVSLARALNIGRQCLGSWAWQGANVVSMFTNRSAPSPQQPASGRR